MICRFSRRLEPRAKFHQPLRAVLAECRCWTVAASFINRDWPASSPLKPAVDEFYTTLEGAGLKPGTAHALGWDAAKIVVAALRALGPNATSKQIHDWIENEHGFAGSLGIYDFRSGNQHGLGIDSTLVVRYDPASNGVDIMIGAGAPR
jgi:ABC-type branched-subunit amino acid transport system substrate-binding protein